MRCGIPDSVRRPSGRRGLPVALCLSLSAGGCAGRDTVQLFGDVESFEESPGAASAARIGACGIGRQRAALSVVDRSLVGDPAAYPADLDLHRQLPELVSSQRLRRERAWQIARRVLAPAPLSAPGVAAPASLPAWQTWHAKDDLTRIFRRVYPELSPEERSARARFPAGSLDGAWAWNDSAIRDFPDWTSERLAAYENALVGAAEVAGVGGIYRVAYAPAASRHLLDSYPEVLGCRESGAPPPPAPPALSRTELIDGCELASAARPACLSGAFPVEASIVKATWRRADGMTLPVYDTSAAGLERRFSPEGKFAWGPGDGRADPGHDEIYTLQLPNGNRFRLAALHIMTKELDHWFWTTLWWSPEPHLDFGADRPAELTGPWQNYKLCATVAFEEGDPDPGGGMADASLESALSSTHSGVGGPTWCSNPYIEEGDGNAATNCIGCHQHAGTGLRSEDILADAERFPDHGRALVRSDFPADYVFAVSVGDDVGAMFQETEAHYAP